MEHEAVDPGAWYRPARVQLERYDDRWPLAYAREADRIREVIGDHLVELEHVGSTAIAGMLAKPTIDILASVASWDRFGALIVELRSIGYVYTPESETEDPGRRVFRKGPVDMSLPRTHHLHVTELDSWYWRRLIAFRDHLRVDAADAAAYIELKRALARSYANDSRAYTRGKTEFVQAIERKRGATS
jgi:GrpB-like predicted nucleotidyltransferase (UPF0157 family)